MKLKCFGLHRWKYNVVLSLKGGMFTVRECPLCSKKQVMNLGKWYDYEDFNIKERLEA
jgi:hypothetical protein